MSFTVAAYLLSIFMYKQLLNVSVIGTIMIPGTETYQNDLKGQEVTSISFYNIQFVRCVTINQMCDNSVTRWEV